MSTTIQSTTLPTPTPKPTITNRNRMWAMQNHGSWFKLEQKKTLLQNKPKTNLGEYMAQPLKTIQSKEDINISPFVRELQKFGKEIILSNDDKITLPIYEKLKSENPEYANYSIFYTNEWEQLFLLFINNILFKFDRLKLNIKDNELYIIIQTMCRLGFVYDKRTIRNIINPYLKYINKYSNLYLPTIIFIEATPCGKSILNYIEHIESKIVSHISGKSLIYLFPGEDETKIPSRIIINLLNDLTNYDRIEIKDNLKEWFKNNPDNELTKLLTKSSSSVSITIPYYKSLCLCKNCKFTVSDSKMNEFLEGNHDASFRNKKKDNKDVNDYTNIMKIKPRGEILSIAKKFLYIKCHSCDNNISISSIITKYLDVSKDNKYDDKDDAKHNEIYKLDDKYKLYIYKIIKKLAEETLIKQFPELTCVVCLEENLDYLNVSYNPTCKHPPCICLECYYKKVKDGNPVKGNFYKNSNYQCLGCTLFEETGNRYIDEFNANGGVQSGYIGRFCYECIKPFQAQPETCGVEEGNTDIPLYCIDCTIYLAEYNKKIRLTVNCPNKACATEISRYEGCDIVECPKCHIQFCYGCEYIFINPPVYEWFWKCSCVIEHARPRQYNEKSQSLCEEKYIDFQRRRGVIIHPTLPELHPVLNPVLNPIIPVLHPALPVLQNIMEDEDILPELEELEEPEDILPNLVEIHSIIGEPIIHVHIFERVLNEDDIQQQILLAENMGEDFSQLY